MTSLWLTATQLQLHSTHQTICSIWHQSRSQVQVYMESYTCIINAVICILYMYNPITSCVYWIISPTVSLCWPPLSSGRLETRPLAEAFKIMTVIFTCTHTHQARTTPHCHTHLSLHCHPTPPTCYSHPSLLPATPTPPYTATPTWCWSMLRDVYNLWIMFFTSSRPCTPSRGSFTAQGQHTRPVPHPPEHHALCRHLNNMAANAYVQFYKATSFEVRSPTHCSDTGAISIQWMLHEMLTTFHLNKASYNTNTHIHFPKQTCVGIS